MNQDAWNDGFIVGVIAGDYSSSEGGGTYLFVYKTLYDSLQFGDHMLSNIIDAINAYFDDQCGFPLADSVSLASYMIAPAEGTITVTLY